MVQTTKQTEITASSVLLQNNNKREAKVVMIMVFPAAVSSSAAHLSYRTMLRVHFGISGIILLGLLVDFKKVNSGKSFLLFFYLRALSSD